MTDIRKGWAVIYNSMTYQAWVESFETYQEALEAYKEAKEANEESGALLCGIIKDELDYFDIIEEEKK